MKNISVSHVITWLTEDSCLYAAPTQSLNNKLIRRHLQIFFFSEKTKSTSPTFGVTSDKTLTYQRVVPQNSILQCQISFHFIRVSNKATVS